MIFAFFNIIKFFENEGVKVEIKITAEIIYFVKYEVNCLS